jgi:hypothetical protein
MIHFIEKVMGAFPHDLAKWNRRLGNWLAQVDFIFTVTGIGAPFQGSIGAKKESIPKL